MALIIPLVVVVACYIPIYIVSRRANKVDLICTLLIKNYDLIYVKVGGKVALSIGLSNFIAQKFVILLDTAILG